MGLMRGIRKNVKGIYWIVTVAVVVTFIFWGTRLGSSGGRRHAGTVFGKKVSIKEFELQWRGASRIASAYGRTPSADLVEAITWQRLVELRAADRWGIIVPMDEVKDRIRAIFSRQGVFDEEGYRDYRPHRHFPKEHGDSKQEQSEKHL